MTTEPTPIRALAAKLAESLSAPALSHTSNLQEQKETQKMALDPQTYLRCISDSFTPVRSQTGRLLGCVPRVADETLAVGPYPLVIAAQACLRVDLDFPGTPSPHDALPGFIPLDDTDSDLALPVGGGDDPDLAEGV